MFIFEFENGSIVNLLSMESLLVDGNKYYLICLSGTKYELTEEEFNIIKTTFKNKLKEEKN